jgi:hypothetical protein
LPLDDDEKVGQNAKRGNAEDNECDGGVDHQEVPRKCSSEEYQRNLQHQRQGFHHTAEMPLTDITHREIPDLPVSLKDCHSSGYVPGHGRGH